MCWLRRVTFLDASGAVSYTHLDVYKRQYQEWLDKGWELYITPDPVFEDDEEWNGQGDPPPVDKWGEYKGYSGLSCYTFWYDKEGNVYDVYGDLFTKLDDPSHRLTRSEILDIRNQNAIGTVVFDSTISVIANPGGNSTIIELDSPIDSITIGTSGTNNAGAGDVYKRQVLQYSRKG